MKKLIALFCLLIVSVITMNLVSEKDAVNLPKHDSPPTAMVTVTMYNATEAQCDKDPLVTAGNYKINPANASAHKYVALSRNLLKRWGGQFDYGDKVRISNTNHKDGIYTVDDTMNKRYKNRIDILESADTRWYRFENVTINKI